MNRASRWKHPDWVGFLAVLLVSGCAGGLVGHGGDLPVERSTLTPMIYDTLRFQSYWQQTARCAGVEQPPPLERIDFYTTSADISGTTQGGYEVHGWWQGNHTIILEDERAGIGVLVRHEMLHDLLETGTHPDGMFPDCSYRNTRVASSGKEEQDP